MDVRKESLPSAGLLALAMAGFICIPKESFPAGLLPQIASGLIVTQALAGQLFTLYAVGSLLATIQLTTATQGVKVSAFAALYHLYHRFSGI